MQKRNESGRSLIEMLGTLAIMGILSVGGIAGFRYGMNRHQANSIIEEAKMHAALITGQALTQGLPASTTLNQLSYEFTYHKESAVGYSLTTSEIEKAVCKILQGQRNLGWAETVLINDGADCKESNQVAFYINTGMTTDITNEDRVVPCESDEDCGECGSCSLEQQICVFDDFYCIDPDKPYCNRGRCQPCERGKIKDKNNQCVLCDTLQGFMETDFTNCLSCPYRYMSHYYDHNYCLFCLGKVPSDGLSCEYECPQKTFPGRFGECLSCSISQEVAMWFVSTGNPELASEYCGLCEERVLAEGDPRYAHGLQCVKKCEAGKIEKGNGSECFDCSTEEKFYLGSRMTKDKPWSRYNIRYQFCLDCSERIPLFIDSNVFCGKCSDSDETLTSLNEDCISQCKGIRYVSEKNSCTLCPEKETDAWNALSADQQEQCTPW